MLNNLSQNNKITAIILAAGIGSRLRPLTSFKPKPLVVVGGQAIIDRQIASLLSNGIERITVVAGYRASSIMTHLSKKFPYPECEINYVFNPFYAKTNTVYSLWLVSPTLSDVSTLVMNGDLMLTGESIAMMLSCDGTCLGLSKHICGKEEVKVQLQDGKVVSIGKGLDPLAVDGEYVGVAKFSKDVGKDYRKALNDAVGKGKIGIYYDDVLQSLLSKHFIKTVNLTDCNVMEIDSLQDFENANAAFNLKNR
jgi:L-glutamine-phosphate cytidylyltransferase